jgi:phospholipid-binding lipoprotein MlaA
LLVIALDGCASQSISIRSLPSEDPAAENAAAMESAAAFAAAASAFERAGGPGAAQTMAIPLTPADAPSMYTYDPWERVNRFTYRFNARFDEAVFLRVSNAYRRVPSPIRSGVHNFFGNLSEVGLLDVAKKLKLPAAATGFSATLARWGMHPGPYVVLPFLGPSTLRDGVGFLGDYGTSYGIDIANLYRGGVSWGLGVANAVDQRSNVSFRYYSTGSPFEYEIIRFLYVRKTLIEDEGLHAKGRRARRPADMPAGK